MWNVSWLCNRFSHKHRDAAHNSWAEIAIRSCEVSRGPEEGGKRRAEGKEFRASGGNVWEGKSELGLLARALRSYVITAAAAAAGGAGSEAGI